MAYACRYGRSLRTYHERLLSGGTADEPLTRLPHNLTDIDFESAFLIVVFLTWAWIVAFALVMAWQMARRWKANRWRFSVGQLFAVLGPRTKSRG